MRTCFFIPFVLIAGAASAQNLVSNGDFSLGNTGFTTAYHYAAPATDALLPDSVYTLTTNTKNPYVLNTQGSGIADYNEHTTGQGLFMAVNGSTSFDSLVWQETLTGLTVGKSYSFETWVSRWTLGSQAAASLQATANGFVITSFQDPNVSGVWEKRSGLFTANSTSVTVQIRSLQTAFVGNDFGLDDISVQAVPEPTSMVALGIGAVAVLRRRRKG